MIKQLIKGVTLIGLLLFSNLQASVDIARSLEQIPTQDKEVLDRFFQCLLTQHPLGYTLFGNKPVSVVDRFIYSFNLNNNTTDLVLEKGWGVWMHHRHLFPSDQFALLKNRRTDDQFSIDSFWLIHKSNTLKVISENLDLFQNEFGEIEPEEMLIKLCKSSSLFDTLGNELSGILFGYGRENAIAFHENPLAFRGIARHGKPESFEIPGNDYNLEHMNLPGFVCWNSKDKLLEAYTKTRKKFRKVYKNRNFLEVILQQWTDPK
jgi:hypothetical protein